MDSEFITLLVFASLISASYCSSCFSCYHDLYNKRNDKCDVIDKNLTFAVTCPYNHDRKGRDMYCRTGERIVKRSCGVSVVKVTNDDDCKTKYEDNWVVKECTCRGNLCNESSLTGATKIFVFLWEFVVLLLALNL